MDLIVCFDASASPIRNIQRIGRTGRHKAGRVIYILSQGREVDNYYKNKEVAVSRAAASACYSVSLSIRLQIISRAVSRCCCSCFLLLSASSQGPVSLLQQSACVTFIVSKHTCTSL